MDFELDSKLGAPLIENCPPDHLNTEPLQIAFACDSRYFHGLALALASVLENTPHLEDAHFHVLDGGLNASQHRWLARKLAESNSGASITFHSLSLERFADVPLLRGSPTTYARLLLPDLFPDLTQILYLDVDVWYGADLNRLWRSDISGGAVGATRDSTMRTLGDDCPWVPQGGLDAAKPYFNAGVLKIDLEHWRRNRVGATALKLAQDEPENCRYHDQTVLNFLLKDSVVWLPEEFNMAEPTLKRRAPALIGKNIHFVTSRKPWSQYSTRAAFRHWRATYAASVSRWPSYMFSFGYWARFEWRELVVGSWIVDPLCSALLAMRIYRVVPALSEANLREQQRRARAERRVGVE
jgi:lipopolysaccharide biosynthesis glycosyltransferase